MILGNPFYYYRITTPRIDGEGDACARFAYHMLGSDTGTLTVEVDSGEVFQVSGQNEDVWVNVNVDVQVVRGFSVSHD